MSNYWNRNEWIIGGFVFFCSLSNRCASHHSINSFPASLVSCTIHFLSQSISVSTEQNRNIHKHTRNNELIFIGIYWYAPVRKGYAFFLSIQSYVVLSIYKFWLNVNGWNRKHERVTAATVSIKFSSNVVTSFIFARWIEEKTFKKLNAQNNREEFSFFFFFEARKMWNK